MKYVNFPEAIRANPQKLVSGGSRISQRRGAPTYYLAKFTKNCMKMKRIGLREGGVETCRKFVCVDPPLVVLMWMRIPVADSPTDQTFLISCSFSENLANLYAGVPSWMVGTPPTGNPESASGFLLSRDQWRYNQVSSLARVMFTFLFIFTLFLIFETTVATSGLGPA